ncbi:hypothetical protein KBZ10_14795 [Streptomyces sp. F63]|uniref:hypothetical protein n=1 Tax=Streptomyces sp. F63 TaxID=2824887 RepID=UPI001B36A18D|nr:hypothetical protein [Streptomyces sp. F63]MBQ0985763.1 hypothetical protein [Streptomyces sp. F63]
MTSPRRHPAALAGAVLAILTVLTWGVARGSVPAEPSPPAGARVTTTPGLPAEARSELYSVTVGGRTPTTVGSTP